MPSKLAAVLPFCGGTSDKSGTVSASQLAKVPAALLHTYSASRENAALYTGLPATRSSDGTLAFSGFPSFQPNLTPEEVLRGGAFGGSYFRSIASGVDGKVQVGAWKELPASWTSGLNAGSKLASPKYNPGANKFGVKSGQDLRDWESSGWIIEIDPFGWFQWYCRFFAGRRCYDDARQISRWGKLAGEKGRWKRNLIAKVAAAGASYDDPSISPVVRQTLWHWGYTLNERDCVAYSKKLKSGAAKAPYIKAPAAKSGGSASSSSSSSSGRKRKRAEN